MKYFLGIDNGLNGGIVVLKSDGSIVSKRVMPVINTKPKRYDINEIYSFLSAIAVEPDKVFTILEKAHPRSITSKRGCFSIGYCFGVMEGLLISLGISYEVVTPQKWMKEVLEGYNQKDAKGSILWCKRKYPQEDWTASERSKVPHDGLTDACCIAHFGIRRWKDV